MRVIFFDNGNTICFDESGNQQPELQRSWLLVYAEFLEKNGFDPTKLEFILPNGWKAQIFKREEGYNWELINCGKMRGNPK